MSTIHDLYLAFLNTGDNTALLSYIAANPEKIDEPDANGNTVLNLAVQCNDANHTQILLDKGGNPNKKNKYGFSPFLSSFLDATIRITNTLLEYGANINDRDKRTWTLLHWSIARERIHDLRLLLRKGADITEIELSFNHDVLHIFLEYCPNNTAILQQLFKWGIGIGHNFTGKTFQPKQLDNMVILVSEKDGNPITRQTPGFEKAITNFEELEKAIASNVGVNFDLLPEPNVIKKFLEDENINKSPDKFKQLKEFDEKYTKFYTSNIARRGLKEKSLFAVNTNLNVYSKKEIEKLPDELYVELDVSRKKKPQGKEK